MAEQFLCQHSQLITAKMCIRDRACPGGCIGGGGMPRHKLPQVKAAKESRIASLYERDKLKPIKAPQDNPEIQVLYNEFYDACLLYTSRCV